MPLIMCFSSLMLIRSTLCCGSGAPRVRFVLAKCCPALSFWTSLALLRFDLLRPAALGCSSNCGSLGKRHSPGKLPMRQPILSAASWPVAWRPVHLLRAVQRRAAIGLAAFADEKTEGERKESRRFPTERRLVATAASGSQSNPRIIIVLCRAIERREERDDPPRDWGSAMNPDNPSLQIETLSV